MTGLVRGTVALSEHDDSWAAEAERCISVLREILGDDALDIRHVGSTAIRGICAKPIIDIAVGVADPDRMPGHNAELEEHGILYRTREHGEQLLYVCGDMRKDIRTHHIHVVVMDSDAWKNYVNFRDYLNCHGEDAQAYSELKRRLAERFPHDRELYTAGKQDFIAGILKKASEWREELPDRMHEFPD